MAVHYGRLRQQFITARNMLHATINQNQKQCNYFILNKGLARSRFDSEVTKIMALWTHCSTWQGQEDGTARPHRGNGPRWGTPPSCGSRPSVTPTTTWRAWWGQSAKARDAVAAQSRRLHHHTGSVSGAWFTRAFALHLSVLKVNSNW